MKKIILCFLLCISVTAVYLPYYVINAETVGVSGIKAKAYVLIDAHTGTVIAAKNEYQKLPMASTTKIMSTLLTIESGDLDSEFTVNSEAIKAEGSSMGLREGDIVTKRALCYGMMLPSGNDAANAAAVKVAGSFGKFAEMMNNRAEKIGMKITGFATPSGLDAPNHYSTAFDMALLTREALKNELFREICSTKSIKLSYGNPPYDRWLTNTNKLLTKYPYCIGVKTGFTDEAGRCLVSAAVHNGVTLICVTLNDPDDWNDHISLYDYGFSVASMTEIPYSFGKVEVDVVGGETKNIALKLGSTPMYTVINGKTPKVTAKLVTPKFVYAPVQNGDVVGYVCFFSGDTLIERVEVIAEGNCPAVIKQRKKRLYSVIIDYIKSFFD